MRISPKTLPRSPSRAFTLLEVLIAAVITGITLVAIGTVMRTGARAWQTGHELSTLYETSRLAQDVIVRDLDNIVFQNESNYNRAFRNQIYIMADRLKANAGNKPGSRNIPNIDADMSKLDKQAENQPNDPYGGLTLDNIAPPIDLSFRGSGGDKIDNLTFARGYQPRYAGDDETWGLRRVTYFVRDGVLYRKEKDPYGAPPTMDDSIFDMADAPEREILRYELERKFYRPDDLPDQNDPSGGAPRATNPEVPLPSLIDIEEPICEGVEIFNITYGYFKDGEWQEVNDWDSSARRYRTPPEDDIDPQTGQPYTDPNHADMIAIPGGIFIQKEKRPDNLPGYVALQIGLRLSKTKGKIHSFTIFYSLAEAQETDTFIDPEKMDPGKVAARRTSHRRSQRNERIKPF